MRLNKWIATLTFACSMFLSVISPVHAGTSHASLYERSGLDRQLGLLWREVGSEYAMLPKKVTHHLFEQSIQAIIKTEFAEPRLRETILRHWTKELSEEDLSAVTEWLKSANGRNVTTAEISASADDENALNEYLASLRKQPPSRQRIELLRMLDKAVRGSAASTDMGININLAAATALHTSGLAPDNSISLVELAESHESDRALIRAMMKQDVLRYNLFVYRGIEDEALRAYIEFAQSPVGAHFHKSTFFATRAALDNATRTLEQKILNLIPEVNSNAQLTSN